MTRPGAAAGERLLPVARRVALVVPLLVALVVPGYATIAGAVVVAAASALFSDAREATFAHGPWLRSLGVGVLCGAAMALAIALGIDELLAALAGQERDLSAFGAVAGNPAQYLTLLVIGLLWGGIVEEIVFRGFVIGWGARLLGRRAEWPLAALSAAAFGFAHLYQGWAGVLTTGLIGLGLGASYLAAGRNLLVAVAAHMTLNAIGITELYGGF